jgi:hypothetical protein
MHPLGHTGPVTGLFYLYLIRFVTSICPPPPKNTNSCASFDHIGRTFETTNSLTRTSCHKFLTVQDSSGYAVAQLVEALRYKPKGREFDSR